ncbi:MAG: hypothetical protein J6B21_02155 [Oscillospiraceae bacterium]|nr:hypothetical protein [Oscillospiraceae bacterium]
MKKLFLSLLLSLCLVLCACEENAQNGVTDGSTQAENTHTTENGTQDEAAENIFVPGENAVKALEKKTAEDFFGSSAVTRFYDAGYDMEITDRHITRYNDVVFCVEFTNRKNGTVYTVENLTAQLEYSDDSLEMSLNNMYIHGAVAAIFGDEIIISEKDCLHFYDLNTFENKGEDMRIDLYDKTPVIIHSVIKQDNIYYASYSAGVTSDDMHNSYQAAYYADKGFLRFDKEGKFSDYPLNLTEDTGASIDAFDLEIRGSYPQYIFAGYYGYDFEKQALYSVQKFAETANEGGTFILEKWTGLSTTDETCWRVTNLVDGRVKEIDTFRLDVNYIFGTNQETNNFEDDLIVQFAHENRDMIITCPHTETTLVLDRVSDTGQVVYNPTAQQITPDHNKIYSRDTRYAIYSGASAGGGDGGASQKILYDSQTGEYRYIDTVSIYDEIGFFSNSDIWVLTDDDFIIYEKGMPSQQPKFVLSDNFPLGKNINDNGVWGRFVFAARRDPEKQDYVVLYAEFPNKECYRSFRSYGEYSDYIEDGWRPTYKLAVLDTDGRMVKSIDTGVNVYMALYDFAHISMYMERENLIHFEASYKQKAAEATVNLVTDEVNVILDVLAQQE